MRSTQHVACVLMTWIGCAAPAAAQYSKMASLIDTIKRRGATINDLVKPQSPDLAAIYAATQQMRDAIAAAKSAITDFGKPLADAALSPHESTLKHPARLAWEMSVQLGDCIPHVDEMLKLANTAEAGRDSRWRQSLEASGVNLFARGNHRETDWTAFARKCDETRRWLSDNVKSATSERDRSMQDCRPIEDAQNTAWARVQTAQRADDKADYDHDRALERVVAAEAKENDCYERYRAGMASGAKSEEAWALRQRWAYAGSEQNDALTLAYAALQTMNSAREELSRAYIQLAAAQRELRQFTATTNADKIVENYNNFVRWVELFDRDMNR